MALHECNNASCVYRYLDLINVMTYDLRGSWEGFTGEDSPLFQGPADQGGYIYFNVVCLNDYFSCFKHFIFFSKHMY